MEIEDEIKSAEWVKISKQQQKGGGPRGSVSLLERLMTLQLTPQNSGDNQESLPSFGEKY
jgi:hypothetical protein